jgi:1,4-dihydroxy-2-naphthoyl-CoA hydrolase
MADQSEQLPLEDTLDGLYGLEILEIDETHARVPVRNAVRMPLGLEHGGVLASIAESITSIATGETVGRGGVIATGLANNTSFLRPITTGAIHAHATRRHRGRTTWLWDVEITDDDGRLCAVTRMTIAVRAPRS